MMYFWASAQMERTLCQRHGMTTAVSIISTINSFTALLPYLTAVHYYR